MSDYGGEDFSEFVEVAIPRLLRTALLLTGSDHDAWDLVQGSLVRVGVRWRRLDRGHDAHAYAQRTLVNLHVSTWRRLRRELPYTTDADHAAPALATDLVDLHEALLPALKSLPPRQRAVVVLRYFEDLTEAQVADRLDCSVGTVKSQHAKAMVKLRTQLAATPGMATSSTSEGSAE
jgi:RNA polymerase sigma-70 factor (sigma-E family)